MTPRMQRLLQTPGPWLMGILNVTEDSFFPGSRTPEVADAVARGLVMAEEGALILDVGGESTRPGADEVPEALEIQRVLPLVRQLRQVWDGVISVDTRHAGTAALALEAGADLINDVSALEDDPRMAAVCADLGAAVVLMHRQGSSKTMQQAPEYRDVVREVQDYLLQRAQAAQEAGISKDRIFLDVGIGFGKTLEHNLTLLRNLKEFTNLGYPLVLGLSRKSFIGGLTGAVVNQRLPGSLAGALAGILQGVRVLRVHDVAETRQALVVFQNCLGPGGGVC